MSFAMHTHAQQGIISPVITLILALLAFFYLRGWFRIRRASPIVFPAWRLAAFMTGLFVIWVTVDSPLAALDHQLLTAHMLKHLLLMTVAAPLILFAAPSRQLLCGLPKRFMGLSSFLRSRTPPFLGHLLSNSIFCWFAGTAAVIAWHIPALFQLGLLSPIWHVIEDTSFLCAGLLFWRPIISQYNTPLQWCMPLYLFLATLPCDILSAFLTFCDRVVYPNYASSVPIFGLSALKDQACAGALMWIWVTFAYVIPAVWITMQLLAPGYVNREREALRERYGSAAAELSGSEMEVV